jgi:hypothetical protein
MATAAITDANPVVGEMATTACVDLPCTEPKR